MSISITQFNHLRIPLDEIQKATNNFSEENIIGKGDFGYIYEGQLLHSGEIINISAKRLDRSRGLGDMEFLTEVSVLSGLRHPNIVSLIGFCDEEGEKIIINRHEAKGSLCMYLDDPTLTWVQRLRISIGVAEAISYLHYEEGRNYSIIHRNINSSTILLDDNFEAKLSGFEFSIKDSVDRMERYISSEVIGTQGYMDPETIKSGDVTQKSDVYSLGVVLWEIVGGRQAFLPNEQLKNIIQAPLTDFYSQNNTQQDIINSDIAKQGTQQSVKLFLIAATGCISEYREERPDSNILLYVLYGALRFQQLPSSNPESSLDVEKDEYDALQLTSKDELGVVVESTPANARKVNKLEHLRIGLIDILKATDNFSDESEAWKMMDGSHVYTGDLELYDRKYVSSLEGKNISELPKRHYNVRIMCFKHATAVDRFYNAIEILSTCKHENIDSLLGFCHEGSHRILVYEGDSCDPLLLLLFAAYLTWDVRLKICLDVAHGLNYLHNEMEDQKMVIHGAISNMCILLDDEGQGVKITGFELSTFRETQDEDALPFRKDDLNIYSFFCMAPELSETGKATKESDIYSFGIVMLEILCGAAYATERLKNAEFRAEHWFKDGKIKQRVAQEIREENRGNKLFLKEGPNDDSLDTFIKITEQCLAVNPEQRPTLQVIIMELRQALMFQENHKDHLRMPFKDIEAATQNFSCAIGGGGFGRVYKGELASEHGSYTIVAKRLDASQGQGDQQFKNELHILSEYKHENVIGLVGYNNDEQERVIVYEFASKGSLDNYLNDASLTWINRLNICIDVARGLAFLHGGVQEHEAVIHRDMKAANILLFDDWKAKVADFGLSLICTINDEKSYVIDYACGTPGYLDPLYQKSRFLTRESDIYSLGVVLFEILSGKSTYEIKKRENQFLQSLVKQRFEEGRLDEVVFNAIKKKIRPEALATFQAIAYQCLHDDREKRPTAQQVLAELEKALVLEVKPSKRVLYVKVYKMTRLIFLLTVMGMCFMHMWNEVKRTMIADPSVGWIHQCAIVFLRLYLGH